MYIQTLSAPDFGMQRQRYNSCRNVNATWRAHGGAPSRWRGLYMPGWWVSNRGWSGGRRGIG